jgi:hypothetical protein
MKIGKNTEQRIIIQKYSLQCPPNNQPHYNNRWFLQSQYPPIYTKHVISKSSEYLDNLSVTL